MKTIKLLCIIILCVFMLDSCTKEKDPDVSPVKEATGAQFYKPTVTLVVGGREKIMLALEPVNAILKNAKWKTNDTTIAKVDTNGIVIAVAIGQVTVTLAADNNIKGQCVLTVVGSPIKDLIMPEAKCTVAKDAVVFIQGSGFTANSKIILRRYTDYKSSKKSANDDGDIIAQIHDQAANYISFYGSVNTGWYSIVLEEENVQYELGNIVVENPSIPEYVYDKNKSIWEDTHWRRFQLRGKVKEMKTSNVYYPYWTKKETYTFNDKGYLKTFGTGNSTRLTTYGYDTDNRLITKSEKCEIHNLTGVVDMLTCQYSYSTHNLYINADISSYAVLMPTGYDDFRYGLGAVNYQDRFDLQMWHKGLIGIKNVLHYKSGNTETTEYKFNISTNKVTTTSSNYTYTWNYRNEMPYESIKINSNTNNVYTTKFNFTSLDMPVDIETTFTGYGTSRIMPLKYIENTPFPLLFSYDDSKGTGLVFTCEYDKNWDIITNDTKYSTVTFYYTSYDNQGNWTQCIVVDKDKDGSNTTIERLSREFTYW